MKKLLLFTLIIGLFAGCKKTEETPAAPTSVSIPDKGFENALIALNIDSDKTINGKLLVSDAEKVYTLDLRDINDKITDKIADITGIEAFKNLSYFRYNSQPIKRLDFKNNPNLTTIIQLNIGSADYVDYLDVSNCLNLQSIELLVNTQKFDFSKHTKLESVSLYGSPNKPFTQFLIGPNTVLKKIALGSYTFETIDLSQVPNLFYFEASGGNLSSIDFSKTTKLEYVLVPSNKLTKLDVTMLPLLRKLYCYDNKLTTVDVSKNPLLTIFEK